MTRPKGRKPRSKGLAKTAAETADRPTLIEQPHGGALLAGGVPGNRGGTGRPRSEIRDALVESFDGQREFVNDVVKGKAMVKARWPLSACAKHLKCSDCGGKRLTGDEPTDLDVIEITVEVSPTVKERLLAVDMNAKYGIGTLKEVSLDAVRERMKETLKVIQMHTSVEQFAAIVREVRPLWAA